MSRANTETANQRAAKHDPKVRDGASTAKGGSVTVVMRDPANVGEGRLEKGDELGTVQLADGVTLAYFADAVRSGLAVDKKAVEEQEKANKEAEGK